MRSKFFISVSAVIIIGIVVFCVIRSSSGRKGRPERIILISIDTCRSDYLSSYGYRQRTTPNIDQLAEEGFLFENVISPVPITLPAHASMLTGTIPPYHGIHSNSGYTLNESNVTIAEILKKHRFTTAAIISAFVLDSKFNLDQGFDSYDDRFTNPLSELFIEQRRGGEASRCAIQWLEEHRRDKKFFLFLHYFDPHGDYIPPEPFATEFASDLYAGEIAYVDHCIGQVVQKLKELNMYDSTLIIVTGDHGEMLGEHGEQSHAYFIYQSAIKVPLIFKLPSQTGSGRIEGLVGIIDIFPTICAAAGIDIPDHVQGRDLSGYLFGKEPPETERYLYCESLLPTRYNAHPLLGVVTDRFKYIQTSRPELYDIVADPAESNDLIGKEPKRAHLLKGRLQDILDRSLRQDDQAGQTALDAETLRRIQSLGYVGGTVVENFGFDPTLDDPKDLIQFHETIAWAMVLRSRKQYAEATVFTDKAIALCPDLPNGYTNKGQIALEQNNYSDAVDFLAKAVAIDPSSFEAHDTLGVALTRLERIDEAIEHFSESVRLKPDLSRSRINLGNLLVRKGRLDEAAKQFAENIKRFPDMSESYLQMTRVLLMQGKVAEAVACSDDMLLACPDRGKLAAQIGKVFHQCRQHKQAIRYWTRSLEIEPDQPEIKKLLELYKTSKPYRE